MPIHQQPYAGEIDQRRMLALARQFPTNNVHVTDLPYRLSSWAFDDPGNASLWIDERQQLVAWAVLQTPFWAIDYAIHPDAERALHRDILAWADDRAGQVAGRPSGRSAWFVNVFTGQTERIRDLEAAGFTSQADIGEDSWSKVLMVRPGQMPVPEFRMPPGFVVRPLAGESEVEAYVELHQSVFESKNMTAEWRGRTLRQPDYAPDLDLVVAAPDGGPVAFCVCWLNQSDGSVQGGQVEPLGCHADYRRYGLGRIALAEGVRRLQAHGAQAIYVETDNYRNTAFALYQSLGFQVIEDVLVFRKDYEMASQS